MLSRRSLLGALAAPLAAVERAVLDLGHRGTRAGPVVSLRDGSTLWITTEPEAPYLAKAMWPISRLVVRRSHDRGRSWGEPGTIMQGTREYSLLSHALRLTASGTLLHIFVRYSGYDYESASPAKSLCEVFAHRSTDNGKTWSEPRKLPTGERYNGDVLSLEQLRDGRIIYPFAFLTSTKGQFATSVLYSDDDGLSWRRSTSILQAGGGGFESGANEPSVVELPDGRLWMLIRAQTGFQWESFSADRGVTWSPAKASNIPASNAPATALRLRSGEIAVAWNCDVQSNYARQSLVLGLTRDGRSFQGLREIDGTDLPDNAGEPALHVTYPYLAEGSDGVVLVSYNKGHWMRYNRPALARVRREWLLERAESVDFRDGRSGWHTVNPGPNRAAAVERYVTERESLWLELEQAPRTTAPAGISRNILQVIRGQVTATLQIVRPEACLLLADSLLPPGSLDSGCVRIRFTGEGIFLGTGVPTTIQRPRGNTIYSYTGLPVQSEERYATKLPADGYSMLVIRFDAEKRRAVIHINDGPEAALQTPPVLGLNYVGLGITGGGVLRLRDLQVKLN